MKAPYLPYDHLRRVVDELLAAHCPALGLPVPIESIVEQNLGLDIIPVRGRSEAGLRDQFALMIGGAPTSAAFARKIGADAHGRDASEAVAPACGVVPAPPAGRLRALVESVEHGRAH